MLQRMQLDLFRSQFSELSPQNQQAMLLLICFHMTILARDLFNRSDVGMEQRLKQAQGMSELNHRITSDLLAQIRSDERRYPDDVLIGILWEIAESYDLQDDFLGVWQTSLHQSGAKLAP